MKSTKPRLAGTHAVAGSSQPQYQPVGIVFAQDPLYKATPQGHNTVVMAFQPSAEDRRKIAGGEAIYVALLTFGGGQQPILLSAGPEEFSERYSIPVFVPVAVALTVEHADNHECCGGGCCDDATGAAEGPSGLVGQSKLESRADLHLTGSADDARGSAGGKEGLAAARSTWEKGTCTCYPELGGCSKAEGHTGPCIGEPA